MKTELTVLGVFSLSLLGCVILGHSVLFALVFGLLLFSAYGLLRGYKVRQVAFMALSGVATVKNILLTFLLIGAITAVWRACGTIAYIVYHAARICTPSIMLLADFLLCCILSFLTGTSFGTGATVGVICMTMSNALGISPILSGGAILAGAYFGDRCSPMSTSALLVSELTGTDIYRNIRGMMRTAIIPFILTCMLYLIPALAPQPDAGLPDVCTVLAAGFRLHPAALLPAAVIIVLSILKMKVKLTLSISILCGLVAAYLTEGLTAAELLRTVIFGYDPALAELKGLLSGGGILSMANVFAIVCLSSSFAGIFNGTGFLDGIRTALCGLSRKITPFGATLATSVIASMIACNQTLSIMMTHQLCSQTEPEPETQALMLENTAVIVAPLVPWSIAGTVVLETVGAPLAALSAACYLYLVPLWNLLDALRRHRRQAKAACTPKH